MKPGPRDLIVWDIIEEHADEAGFLGAQWERALDKLPRPQLADHAGHADDRNSLLQALRRGSMRRRHALALRLAIVTGGHTQLETRAPARRQLLARTAIS